MKNHYSLLSRRNNASPTSNALCQNKLFRIPTFFNWAFSHSRYLDGCCVLWVFDCPPSFIILLDTFFAKVLAYFMYFSQSFTLLLQNTSTFTMASLKRSWLSEALYTLLSSYPYVTISSAGLGSFHLLKLERSCSTNTPIFLPFSSCFLYTTLTVRFIFLLLFYYFL